MRFVFLILGLAACSQSDYTPLRDGLIEQWWHLDSEDLEFNVYLMMDDHYLNEGQLWYNEEEPFLNPNKNVNGGTWKLPNGEELELGPSDNLKQLIVDEGLSPISPNQLSFSIEADDECYDVVLIKLPIDESGTACPYDGAWR